MPSPILVTFAIATHNRRPVVVDCLRQVIANGLPAKQFEIIVIDNASADGTPDLIAQEFGARVKLIRLGKNCGPVAKNIAIRKARGEFIVLLDDDAFPHPGAVPQMIRHFRENPNLGAAVFDVTLPDGSKDSAAYPDVFIGAGTGLRASALDKIGRGGSGGGRGMLPAHYFMQAEEYDLSFRLLEAGFSVERFWDLPLTHLKTPNARIGQRTTALDVRNNLFLLARYMPQSLAEQLAADWMSRYWMMAEVRDYALDNVPHPTFGTHREAFLQGAGEGLNRWKSQRGNGQRILSDTTIERIFKFRKLRERMAHMKQRTGAQKIVFAEFGKNMLAYWMAAQDAGLEVLAILDDRLAEDGAGGPSEKPREYRGIPIVATMPAGADAIVLANMSPVQAPTRAAALRRVQRVPVIDLFSRQDRVMQSTPLLPA
jgi:glycosyltransferase involved in cell wall biosynthesis